MTCISTPWSIKPETLLSLKSLGQQVAGPDMAFDILGCNYFFTCVILAAFQGQGADFTCHLGLRWWHRRWHRLEAHMSIRWGTSQVYIILLLDRSQ